MRGDNGTPDIIIEIHRLLRMHAGEPLGPINRFVLNNTFRLNPNDFGSSLRFAAKHIVQLGDLWSQPTGQIEDNWLALAVEYALTNIPRVQAWIDFDAEASGLIAEQRPDDVKQRLLALHRTDQQSMYSMRLYASLHAYSDSAIKEYLSGNLTSSWFKGRLLYPLIFHAINQPSETSLYQMLEHLLPVKAGDKSEHKLIHFLLEPQRVTEASLSFRCYVGLMSHPYDALEYITQHLELVAAERRQCRPFILTCVDRLSEAFPDHRISRLRSILHGASFPLIERPSQLSGLNLTEDMHRQIIHMADASRESADAGTASPLTNALASLRWNVYPVKSDYDLLDTYRTRFAMLSTGTLVDWLSRALFLFEREDYRREQLWLFRGALMCGGVFPLLMMGPTGPQVIDPWSNSLTPPGTAVLNLVEKSFGARTNLRNDRLWISVSNWRIALLQRQGKLAEWCKAARSTFPVWLEPRYLSGLDWVWLSQVIKQVGVLPLRGHADGIYVLFLRQVEESLREYSALRIAMEPFVERGNINGFFDWAIQEYGTDALAIIRVTLTPDTILKLRLAENYTAALTARLTLLESGVKKFGFIDGVLSEDDLSQESANLTASLSRMSLGARQFELPWDTLKADAVTRNQAAYDAYTTMKSAMSDSSSITNTRRVSKYPYSGGAIIEYEARNGDWPLVLTIAGIIDTFLTHPTAGIEAILSVRIRHDAFRREVLASAHQVANSQMPGVHRATIAAYAKAAEPALSRQINNWLDARMHTVRKGKEGALFEFAPTRSEMSELLAEAIPKDDFSSVIDIVFDWIEPRLDAALERARASLNDELCPRLKAKLVEVQVEVQQLTGRPAEVDRIALATGTALERRLLALQEWFRVPERLRDHSLTMYEIYLAVQQRFQPHGKAGGLRFGDMPPSISGLPVRPEHIRHMYDLLSEIAQNAIKHNPSPAIRLRLGTEIHEGRVYLVASNLTARAAPDRVRIEGHPYEKLTDSLFGEGNSGCKKIAYLNASIQKRVGSIDLVRRRQSFHVLIPIADHNHG